MFLPVSITRKNMSPVKRLTCHLQVSSSKLLFLDRNYFPLIWETHTLAPATTSWLLQAALNRARTKLHPWWQIRTQNTMRINQDHSQPNHNKLSIIHLMANSSEHPLLHIYHIGSKKRDFFLDIQQKLQAVLTMSCFTYWVNTGVNQTTVKPLHTYST